MLTIVGVSLALTGVGAVVGVPLAIAGASIGAAGGATTGISAVVEATLKRKGLKEVQEDLDMDRLRSEQVVTLLQRASENPELAALWKIDPMLLANVGRAVPALAKVGVTSAAGAETAFGVLRASAGTSFHIFALALAAALIPLDLGQLIISSIKVHKKKPSVVVKRLIDIADRLEDDLRGYLVKEGYFRVASTCDGCWAFILTNAEKKQECEERIREGCTFEELQHLAEVVEYGSGALPSEVADRFYSEWYSKVLLYM